MVKRTKMTMRVSKRNESRISNGNVLAMLRSARIEKLRPPLETEIWTSSSPI